MRLDELSRRAAATSPQSGTQIAVHRRHDGHDRRLRARRSRGHRDGSATSWSRRIGLDYAPHVHADAVIGWAWSVFNDYDFDANPLGFRHRTRARARRRGPPDPASRPRRLDRHRLSQDRLRAVRLERVLVRDGRDLDRLARSDEEMPYLFQSGDHHPGKYTLETTRSGSGIAGGARQPAAVRQARPAGRCSAISSRWPRCCASTSKATPRRRC